MRHQLTHIAYINLAPAVVGIADDGGQPVGAVITPLVQTTVYIPAGLFRVLVYLPALPTRVRRYTCGWRADIRLIVLAGRALWLRWRMIAWGYGLAGGAA